MMSSDYYANQIVQRCMAGQRPGAALPNLINAVKDEYRQELVTKNAVNLHDEVVAKVRENAIREVVAFIEEYDGLGGMDSWPVLNEVSAAILKKFLQGD
jgi:hypothetical protein